MTTRDLEYFKTQAEEKKICLDYALLWAKCGNNRNKLFELAMYGDSIVYVATSTYDNWGMSYDFILNYFNDYINSEIPFYYIEEKDLEGLSYQWKLQENNKHDELTANITHLCNCKGSEFIVGTDIAELYITNDSDVVLDFKEDCRFNIYLLNNSKVTLNNLGDGSKITIYDYNSTNTIVRGENSKGVMSIKQQIYNYNNGR